MSILCDIEVSDKPLILSPALHWHHLFKKIRRQIIYGDLENRISLKIHNYSLPAFFPELGCMLSLDMTSENLRRDFEEKTMDFGKKANDIVISDIYNFDRSTNRIVSRGNYKFNKIDEKFHKLYSIALFTDLLVTPSLYLDRALCTPLRWFRIQSDDKPYFKSTANYNSAIVYLTKRDILNSEKMSIWMGERIEVFKTRCKIIRINQNGGVWADNIFVFFRNHPENLSELEELSNGGSYFIFFMISLNEYKTSYHLKKYYPSINVVNYIIPLIYSKYDIFLMTLPLFSRSGIFSEKILQFNVNKKIFNKIIMKFTKFGEKQAIEMLRNYDKIYEHLNPFIQINSDIKDSYVIKVLNPGIIFNLIKMHLHDNPTISRNAREVMQKSELLLKEIQEPSEFKYLMIPSLSGLWEVNGCRKTNMNRYLELFKKF